MWRPTLTARGSTTRPSRSYEKALEIFRRLLTDEDPRTASATTTWRPTSATRGSTPRLSRYIEKALEIRHRLLTDDHPDTALSYNNLAANLNAQGKYLEARDQWLRAVKSLDKSRLRVAFNGLERAAGTKESAAPRPGRRAGPARSASRGVAGARGRPGPRTARRAGRAARTSGSHPPSTPSSAN